MGDRVEIKVLAGRDLKTSENGVCNACVRLRFATETALTKTVSRSSNPTWSDDNAIVFSRVVEKGADHVMAEVLHSNIISGQLDVLGVVPLSLAGCMLCPGIPVDEW